MNRAIQRTQKDHQLILRILSTTGAMTIPQAKAIIRLCLNKSAGYTDTSIKNLFYKNLVKDPTGENNYICANGGDFGKINREQILAKWVAVNEIIYNRYRAKETPTEEEREEMENELLSMFSPSDGLSSLLFCVREKTYRVIALNPRNTSSKLTILRNQLEEQQRIAERDKKPKRESFTTLFVCDGCDPAALEEAIGEINMSFNYDIYVMKGDGIDMPETTFTAVSGLR